MRRPIVAILVASAFLAGGLSGSRAGSGAQTSVPSQADAANAAAVVSAYIAAHPDTFQVEYKTAATTFCPKDNTAGYDGLKLVEDHQNGTNRLACRNG